MTPRPLVLRAEGARQNRRGRWLGIFAIAFFFVWLFGLNEVLLASDVRERLPGWLPGLLISVALIPGAVWYVSLVRPTLGRALGLTQEIFSQATLDPSGVELSVHGSVPERHTWDEISALERADRDWRLVGPGGATVAKIPRELALPRASMWDAPTLAEAIVEMRPDRYALRAGPWEPGLTEFALREAGDPIGRPRGGMHSTMLAVGVVLFLVAFLLLVFMVDRLG
jgi:hypothetical protein